MGGECTRKYTFFLSSEAASFLFASLVVVEIGDHDSLLQTVEDFISSDKDHHHVHLEKIE
jgi:hypothetical protein